MDDKSFGGLICGRGRDFSVFHSTETGSGAHPASCKWILEVKLLGAWNWPFPFSTEVMNVWSCTCIIPYFSLRSNYSFCIPEWNWKFIFNIWIRLSFCYRNVKSSVVSVCVFVIEGAFVCCLWHFLLLVQTHTVLWICDFQFITGFSIWYCPASPVYHEISDILIWGPLGTCTHESNHKSHVAQTIV